MYFDFYHFTSSWSVIICPGNHRSTVFYIFYWYSGILSLVSWKWAEMSPACWAMITSGISAPSQRERGRAGGKERKRDRVLVPTVKKWFLCFGVSTGDRSTHCQSGEKRCSNNERTWYFSCLSLPPVALSQLLTMMLSCLTDVMFEM